MAQNNTLKEAIRSAIKQNGNNEITGALLQQVLLSMVNSLGVGYMYMGMATPATNPGTPDQNVFYFAIEAGTYSNFGGIVLSGQELAILCWDGEWHLDTIAAAGQSGLFIPGTGTNSIQQKETGAVAMSEASFATGVATHSGTKGFKWTSWDKASLTFTLEKALPKAISNNAWLSIVNDSHYDKCCQVDGNVSAGSATIRVKTSPFDTKVSGDTGYDAYTIMVVDDPTIGDIDLGQTAHAEGGNTKALQMFSHAEGYGTEALGQYSHAEGRENKAVYAAHAEGRGTEAMGNYAHTEGQTTKAYGGKSHAEGTQTETYANNSHTEGFRSIIKDGAGAHAEGYGNVIDITENTSVTTTTATGQSIGAHAEGVSNKAAGIGAHAEGRGNTVNEEAAHVEGKNNMASGRASHAEGFTTRAGNLEAPTEQTTATEGWFAHAEGNSTLAKGSASHAEGAGTKALARAAHAEGRHSIALGNYSHAEGFDTMAGKPTDDVPQPTTIANTTEGFFAHAEGHHTLASGNSSHAEGKDTEASGNSSHAEGASTVASGYRSHAEGDSTTASGSTSHAEGTRTVASGNSSHAEGSNTDSSGNHSHTEGTHTITYNLSEHAEGHYNKSNKASGTYGNAGNTQHSVGIGTSATDRKNAFEVMQNGDIYVIGLGGYNGINPTSAHTLQKLINNMGFVMMNGGVAYETSGQAETEAATSVYAGNPLITVMSYWYNGPQRGVGNGKIEQSIYLANTVYECRQILVLGGVTYKRVITLGDFNLATNTFPIVTVGAWAQQ